MIATIKALPVIAALLSAACGPTTYVVHQAPVFNPCDPAYYEPFACQRAIGMGGYYYGGTYYPLSGGHTFIYYQQQEQQFVARGGRPKPVDATKLVFKEAPQSKSSSAAASNGTPLKEAPQSNSSAGTQFKFTPKTAPAPPPTSAAPPASKFQTTKPPAPSPAPAPKSFSFTPKNKK